LIGALLALQATNAWSSDACSMRAIVAAADVTVSDGSEFGIESYFHSIDNAAIRHVREDPQLIAVEGPLGWAQTPNGSELGDNFYKLFGLGHQFHAFLLHFDELVSNARTSEDLAFANEKRAAASGDYPYGGVVHLVNGDIASRPAGLLFEFPDTPPISVTFEDWRALDGVELPFRMQIDDGERVFDYRYSDIDINPRSPLWFHDAVVAPPIDEVQVYRLHRKLLAAHCLGDADMMAALSAPELVVAGRGDLGRYSSESTRERFTGVFQRLDYTGYHDLAMPIIRVSEASDIGWIAVEVRAVGAEIETGTPFDDQWAWVMMVEKINDAWVHKGNASNHRSSD
jgi:ketosteroid isomerase-like protein